ncbi:MAG: hypothetical protein RLZZ116_2136 [Planctomycetota bacterium]|jgi:ABC-type sugar transport system ATPase subunit
MQGGAASGHRRTAEDGLSLDGVSFSRGAKAIVRDVAFTLAPGRILVVLGPSGAGKSTLLALIAGFETPDSGRITCRGRDMAPLPMTDRGVGMSFDDAALHEHLTVAQNLDSAAVPRGEPRERRAARVRSIAESLGLAALLDRKPATLSAGERRRVSVGRAFIRSPEIALLDEPFANLDRGNRFTIRQMVRELQRSTGAMTVVVTHDPSDALAIADDLLVLIDGAVRAHGPAQQVAAEPPDLEVAQLVDELGMHAIEVDARGCAPGCAIPEAIRLACPGSQPTILGIRPWHVRLGSAPADALRITARIIAREPAGVFADLIAVRADGRTLRARLSAPLAQDLPIGATAEFHVHREDVHLFEGSWPGRRLRPDSRR